MASGAAGPLASFITGSVGDVCFRNTRHGLIIQRKPIPTGPPSPGQVSRRDIFKRAMLLFPPTGNTLNDVIRRALTGSDRTLTQDWASSYSLHNEERGILPTPFTPEGPQSRVQSIQRVGTTNIYRFSIQSQYAAPPKTLLLGFLVETQSESTGLWSTATITGSFNQFDIVFNTAPPLITLTAQVIPSDPPTVSLINLYKLPEED